MPASDLAAAARTSPAVERRVALRPERGRAGRRPSRACRRGRRRGRGRAAAVVRELLRPRDVDLGERLADVPRAGVEHEPDAVCSVSRQSSMKWLPPPSVPELTRRLAARPWTFGRELVELGQTARHRRAIGVRRRAPTGSSCSAKPTGIAASIAERRPRAGRRADRSRAGWSSHRGHAAADVDADRRRRRPRPSSRSPSRRSRPCRSARRA